MLLIVRPLKSGFVSGHVFRLRWFLTTDQAIHDILNWNGNLPLSNFYAAACAFAEKWNKFNSALPEWSWVHWSDRPRLAASHGVEGYLTLENVSLPRTLEEKQDEGSQHEREELSLSDTDEPTDSALLVQSDGQYMHHYDFHITYSPSYRVPVLYFRAYTNDGRPLPLDEIEKDLPSKSRKILMESKWNFMTQAEHPYLNRPWCTLHPCGTSEWMKLLLASDDSAVRGGVAVEQYLVSWFSVVCQAFGFRIPLQMLGCFEGSS